MDKQLLNAPRDLSLAVRRGALGRCPSCGKGRLFRSYLKQVDACACCHETLSHIRADDGPPWLTILVVGHIVVALALVAESNANLPTWPSVAVFSGLAVAMSLTLLPRAKGIFIGAIWASRLAKVDGD